jgi:hypothetical protein
MLRGVVSSPILITLVLNGRSIGKPPALSGIKKGF